MVQQGLLPPPNNLSRSHGIILRLDAADPTEIIALLRPALRTLTGTPEPPAASSPA
jgi:hypothetical protein